MFIEIKERLRESLLVHPRAHALRLLPIPARMTDKNVRHVSAPSAVKSVDYPSRANINGKGCRHAALMTSSSCSCHGLPGRGSPPQIPDFHPKLRTSTTSFDKQRITASSLRIVFATPHRPPRPADRSECWVGESGTRVRRLATRAGSRDRSDRRPADAIAR